MSLKDMKLNPQNTRLLAVLFIIAFSAVFNKAYSTSTYYARMTATAIGPTGAGTVYAVGNEGSGDQGVTSIAIASGQGAQNSSVEVNFTLTATVGNDIYDFKGWTTDNNINGTIESSNNPYTATRTASSTNQNSPTSYNIYAVFAEKPLFYFSATAIVAPTGAGTASASPSTVSVRGEHWNSTSATTDDITFTATTNTGYEFLGWSETADGSIVSTDNPYYPTLTSTSTDSGNPTNTTLYARFEPDPTDITITSTSPVTIYMGNSGTVTYTLSPTGAYHNVTGASSNTSIFTVATVGGGTAVINPVAVGSATLTLTAYKLNGDPITPAEVTVNVRDRLATPEISFTPIGTGNKANCEITCATTSPTPTIRYTINGDAPTATTGTVYNGTPFEVNDGDVVRAIAVTDETGWDNSLIATAVYHACSTNDPTITYVQTGTTATVTITAEIGATIYYTTDGNNPNSNSSHGTTTVTLTGVADGTTVKAYAKNSDCSASNTVSEEIILSGVSGDVVTLNDREDHSWSYYSDPECPIRSLNPADVKITYLGNGKMYTSITPNPSGDLSNATGVKVEAGSDANTFVYYKTLERTDGSTAATVAEATGRCAYKTIPNPFSVRPTFTSGANTYYTGFYTWRVKSVSGGTIYTSSTGNGTITAGGTIDAETEVFFAPTSSTGMEVELEAVWARAYVVTSNTTSGLNNNVSYERNFVYLSENTTLSGSGLAYPVTYTTLDPATGTGTKRTITFGAQGNNYFNCQADTKFENVNFASRTSYSYNSQQGTHSGTPLAAGGHNLVVGRGCTTGTVSIVEGYRTSPSANSDYSIRLESGTFTTYFAAWNENTACDITLSVKTIFGCDYDRANNSGNGDNTKLSVGNGGWVYGGEQMCISNSNNRNNLTFDWLVKSGSFNNPNSLGGGDGGDESIYLGSSQAGNGSNALRYIGKRRMIIEGGIFASIAGAMNSSNANTSSSNNDYSASNFTVNDGFAVDIRVKGGTINGCIYGAAAFAGASGDRRIVVSGGKVLGWIAGGANGTHNDGGELYGDTRLYVGGSAEVGNSTGGNHVGKNTGSSYGVNGADGGHVFGAGCGILPHTGSYQNGTVGRVNNSTIVVADDAHIWRDVHGGGNYGWVRDNGASVISILGGTIGGFEDYGSVFGGSNNQQGQMVTINVKGGDVKGGVYGGSHSWGTINNNVTMNIFGGTVETGVFGGGYGTTDNSCDVSGTVNITMTGGTVLTGLYGGGNVRSVIGGTTQVKVNGGTVGASDARAGVYGGGLGQNTRAGNSVTVTIGAANATSGATIYGDVYGGSAKGLTNYTGSAASGTTAVTLNAGTIHGSLYGGGHGLDNANANVYGAVTVTVNGGSVKDPDDPNGTDTNPGSVFGCNNAAGSPKSTVTVTVNATDPTVLDGSGNKTYAINGVYGGGNEAHYDPTTPSTYPTVTINGCSSSIKDVYGGGNAAAVPYTQVTIIGGDIDRVFAGGNGESGTPAHVGYMNTSNDNPTSNPYTSFTGVGNATALIYGGTINQVFGGSNAHGVIRGDVSVTIDKSLSTANPKCDMIVGEVYGGGNMAESKAASVSIGCTGAIVTGDNGHAAHPENIGTTLEGIGSVFGGANQADVTSGNIEVNINKGIVANVFGGNNKEGNISGSIEVNIEKTSESNDCGWYVGNVFGGGNLAQYTGSPVVNIKNGTVSGNVYGGGKGLASDHSKGKVTGNPIVTIGDNTTGHESYVATVTGDVYGGGDAGNVVGTPVVNVVNKCNTSISGDVYGGGNAADVSGTDVNIDGGNITGMVFGGGHGDKNANPQTEANVTNDVSVTVTGGTINKVFGGSNSKGTIGGEVTVEINKGASSCEMHINEVYGGGNEADGNAGTITIECTGDYETNGEGITTVYGGANAANIGNDINLTIKGGHIDNVYGGNNANGSISGSVAVTVNWDDALTCGKYLGNVFGGGNLAPYSGTPTVTLTKGTVSHNVFGGGNQAGVGGSLVNINGGRVMDGIYGGCNASGTVTGNIIVNINGGTLGVSGTPLTKGIFGGGLGHDTYTNGNVTVNVGDAAAASADVCPVIYGDIYGGSAEGNVNDATEDLTTVNFNNGTIHGNIYGGGLGVATVLPNGYLDPNATTTDAIVNGTVHVNIGTSTQASNFVTIDGKVFGCNNLAGTPKGPVYVDVYRTAHSGDNFYPNPEPSGANNIPTPTAANFAISEVYGGGNLAHYTTNVENASTHVHIHNCDNTIQYVYGGGNAANTVANEVTIDGGRMEYVFGGGNGAGTGNPGANVDGNAIVKIDGGIINYVFGGSNTLGVVNGVASMTFAAPPVCTRMVKELYGGGNEAPGGSVDLTIPCGVTGLNVVYGGSKNADIGSETLFNGGTKKNVVLTIEGGVLDKIFGGNNQGGTIWGDVTLNLKGGTIVDAFGGNNAGGNIKGTITVNVEDAESTTCPLVLTNVFGGGKDAAYTPADTTISGPLVNIKHKKSGTSITGSVFGGGQGSTATVTANPVVTIGDSDSNHLATIAGNVYGGGDAAAVTGNTTVTYNDNNASSSVSNLFGGGNAASVSGTATVNMTSGKVTTGIYGGCNSSGTVGGDITVSVTGGTIGTDADHTANVHGGGYGNGTSTSGNVNVTINGASATIWGDVYGGSAKGHVNDATSDQTNVTLTAGTIHGDLYGGGLGDGTYAALVKGAVQVTVNGGTVTGSVYGCNNANGAPQSTVKVDIYGTDTPGSGYALANVFGGGNLAAYTGTPDVTIHNCDNSIGYVYGGGNAAPVAATNVIVYGGNTIGNVFGGGNGTGVAPDFVMVSGNAVTNIYGGTIGKVFGGNNSSGLINGTVTLNVNKQTESGHSSCDMKIGEVYGGGNLAAGKAGSITIGCTGTLTSDHSSHPENIGTTLEGIGTVYGGANQANIGATGTGNESNITLNINSGMVANVFGGNNISGSIFGTITVTIEKTSDACGWYVGNVFGAGNQAQYAGSPAVNIKNGTVSGNVYGGGMGLASDHTKGQVTGNPVVTIGDNTTGHESYVAAVTGDVYGGGDAGNVVGTPQVNVINKCNTSIGNVYGGGNAADVNGTDVNIDGGTITGMVFGGGHGDKTSNPQKEANVNGDVAVDVTGGTINKVFGGSNSKGSISGTVAVNINKGTNSCDMHITEVYGGGNEAAGNAGTITIGCTGTASEGIGDVYGGANAADINNDITLNITGGKINNVYGGNNSSGTISGTIVVNVEWTGTCGVNSLGNVYGAGNMAPYTGSPAVNIKNGTVSQNVYGGGKGNTAVVTGAPVVTIGDSNANHVAIVTGDVYGGGDAAAVTGTTTVAYNDSNASSTVGKLFGGGNAAGVSSTATVTLTNGTVTAGIYGGCNSSGNIGGKITVNVNGGTVGALTDVNTLANVFGGGFGDATSTTGDVEVNIIGGTVNGNVYGGSAFGSVNTQSGSNTTTVNVTGGTLKTIETSSGGFPIYNGGNVFGGGLGVSGNANKGKVNGVVTVNIGTGTPDPTNPFTEEVPAGTLSGSATIEGNVYGCNNSGGSPQDNVTVNIFQTAHTEKDLASYLGNDRTYAIHNVFGGGNQADYTPTGTDKETRVNIYTCNNTVERVFGGSNAASAPHVATEIQGGRFSKVFGGGNGEVTPAHITDGLDLTIHGGNVGEFYGGSNQQGSLSGVINVNVVNDGPCESMNITEFFCGGNFVDITGDLVTTFDCSSQAMVVNYLYGGCNQADIKGNVVLNVHGGEYDYVFGGSKGISSKAANIKDNETTTSIKEGNVTLNLFGGTIGTVFGGSNINGNIEGVITVNVLDEESNCPLYITNIYGGSNETDYTPDEVSSGVKPDSPVVNVVHAKYGISGNVYGGSKGIEGAAEPTKVTANPLVNIGYDTSMDGYIPATYLSTYSALLTAPRAIISGSVFGGGDAAKVQGNTAIFLRNRAKVFGNVYGGGNMGEVTGDTKVIVNGANE